MQPPPLTQPPSPPPPPPQHELKPDRVVMGFLPWAHIFGQTCELHVQFAVGSAFAIIEKRYGVNCMAELVVVVFSCFRSYFHFCS